MHPPSYDHSDLLHIEQPGFIPQTTVITEEAMSLPTQKTPAPRNALRRVAAASLAGNAIEYYDFSIYGLAAALVFPQLFFPRATPS